jgi:uncharacterized protein RhaS with RHS repeats
MQDLRARYYDPATGQFISRDPMESSTLQPYAYAGNDPTNATDPTGLAWWSTASDTAAGLLDGASGGLTTRLAASALGFDVECASFGRGFAAGQVTGMLAGMTTGEGEAALAARAGEAAKDATKLVKGARYPLSPKIQEQLAKRDWTTEAIDEAVQSGKQVRAVNKATGNPATRYIHPNTGQSVVIDDVTGQVIHVGGPGFKYGPGSGDLP